MIRIGLKVALELWCCIGIFD